MSAPRIHIQPANLRLFGAHVCGRAIICRNSVNSVFSVSRLWHRLGDAEIDHHRYGLVIMRRYQHVGRLEIAMDDPFLMGALHGIADRDEQLQSLPRCSISVIAIVGDGDALDSS